MDELQNLLNDVIRKTDALKTAKSLYSRQLAPRFNTFDYVSTNELGLSQILADLLNPEGSHAQQESFLRLFIEHCLPDMFKNSTRQNFLDNIEKTKVVIEQVTSKSNSLRRMDIYLECQVGINSYGICIENKPSAADQPNQLIDYYIELEARGHTDLQIVYLNENNDTPNPISVDTETLENWKKGSQYSHLRFSDLVSWLKACQIECQNHSVTEFLAQLIKFIQKQFMGIEDMNESESVLEIMLLNKENISNSLKIATNIHDMKKQLIQKLQDNIITTIEKNKKPYKMIRTELKGTARQEEISFVIQDSKLEICFGFGGTDFKDPYLGLFIADEYLEDELKNYEIILTECKNSNDFLGTDLKAEKDKSKGGYWCAWHDFQPHDSWSGTKAWEEIHEDKMTNQIVEVIDNYYRVLKENSFLST